MISGYAHVDGRLRQVSDPLSDPSAVWIDLLHPTDAEEDAVEAVLGVGIPTRAEMEEIEVSSRLYFERDVAFMTANIPAYSDNEHVTMGPVTFVLAADRLVTIRYHDPRAFRTFPGRAEKAELGCGGSEATMMALLEAIVDRIADVLERVGGDIDGVSSSVFNQRDDRPTSSVELKRVLRRIGRLGDLLSKIRDSLVSFERLLGFLGQVQTQRNSDRELRGRLKAVARDTHDLADHASFLTQKITFLLDAMLGLVGIEQNGIIKIFSVAAVVFMPPTLVASIYGMNFEVMPELRLWFGYPMALVMMVVSAILPFLYFKHRGWL
jgi:magnesium transporter